MKALAIPDTAPRSTPKDAPVVKVALKSAERTGNKVTLPGDINFQPKKSVLLPAATPTLEALAQFMKENKSVSKLRIEGHTDGDGSGMVELSQARSAAVKAWLVKNGVDASRLVASGCGGKYPELDAHGKKDMAKSRRTETVVLEDDGKAVAGEQALRAGCKAD